METQTDRNIKSKDKKFKDYTKKQQEMIKEIVLARLKQSKLPNNIRLSIG